MFPNLVLSYEERVRYVEGIVKQHKMPTTFETFSSQVFSLTSPQGNQQLLVVRDRVGRLPGELGVKQVHGM